jgi:hypothetical protein
MKTMKTTTTTTTTTTHRLDWGIEGQSERENPICCHAQLPVVIRFQKLRVLWRGRGKRDTTYLGLEGGGVMVIPEGAEKEEIFFFFFFFFFLPPAHDLPSRLELRLS